jgi:hypothetical protein
MNSLNYNDNIIENLVNSRPSLITVYKLIPSELQLYPGLVVQKEEQAANGSEILQSHSSYSRSLKDN